MSDIDLLRMWAEANKNDDGSETDLTVELTQIADHYEAVLVHTINQQQELKKKNLQLAATLCMLAALVLTNTMLIIWMVEFWQK